MYVTHKKLKNVISLPSAARESSAPKEELYKTPPSSPIPSRNVRAPLTKVNSFEKSATPTPPATPSTERSDKVGSAKPQGQLKLTDRKALDSEDLKSKLSPEVEKSKDTRYDTSVKQEADKGHGHVTFSPVLERGPGVSTLSSTKQPGVALPKTAETPDSKQTDNGDKKGIKSDLTVAGKKDSPAITASKKDSPVAVSVAVVAPTVKSSSTTAIREAQENSTAEVGLSGGLPVGGARSRYRSPPFRNDRCVQFLTTNSFFFMSAHLFFNYRPIIQQITGHLVKIKLFLFLQLISVFFAIHSFYSLWGK